MVVTVQVPVALETLCGAMVAQVLPLTCRPHADAHYALQPCFTIRVYAADGSAPGQTAAVPSAPQLIQPVGRALLRHIIAIDHTLSTFDLYVRLKCHATEYTVRC